MEITTKNVIYAVILILVLSTLIIGGLYLLKGTNIEFIDRLADWSSDDTAVIEEPQDIQKVKQKLFTQFVTDYQSCKNSPDFECLCPIKPITIPEGTYLEILNTNTKTRMSLVEGTFEDNQPKTTERGTQQWTEITQPDEVKVSFVTPGHLYEYIRGDKFNMRYYFPSPRTYLTFDPESPTKTLLTTELDIRGENNYNFHGIYKPDPTITAFVPTPDSLTETRDRELLTQLKTLKTCKVYPGYPEAKTQLLELKQELERCINLNTALNDQCSFQDFNLQTNFNIRATKTTLSLHLGEKQLLQHPIALQTKLGICSYPQNTIKHNQDTPKSYSESFKIDTTVKRTTISFTEDKTLCLTNYDESGMKLLEEQSLRAQI